MARTVGIDLGTSNTVVATIDERGKPYVLKNLAGQAMTPSAVFFDPPHFSVGEVAVQSALAEPGRVVQFAKRHMGQGTRFTVEGREYSPEMVSSIVLRKAVQDAEEALNESIEAAVITVPAYFGEAQRQATYNAAQLAGINVLRLINEPTAAALAYGISHSDEPGYVLVYDLGGGTFDVTILAIRPQSLDVVGIAGDPALGGKDFDDAICRYLRETATKEFGSGLLWDAASDAELRLKAETAKRQLSGRTTTPVPLKLRRQTGDGGEDSVVLRPQLSRDQFEELCSPLLSRTQIITHEVLRKAKLGWDDIRHIICVGGSSRMPAVRRVLEDMAGRAPLLHDPDECVAKGAALQAALLAGESDLKSTRVSHVLPRPLGVAALRNGQPVVDHIVPSLTPLPYAGVRHGYTTSIDFQSAVQVPIYEGESTDLESYAHGPIGSIKLEIQPPRKKGQPSISVEFRCDENGLIMAVARDADSGKESGTTISLHGNLGDARLRQEASLMAQAIIS